MSLQILSDSKETIKDNLVDSQNMSQAEDSTIWTSIEKIFVVGGNTEYVYKDPNETKWRDKHPVQ